MLTRQSFLSTTWTFSVHTTGQASCVELASKVTVWFLGTSQCKQCTNNNHLALLIPFAVMGITLVFLLLICKLTVATGTLSGLVFYTNIVGVNRTVFILVESTDPFSLFEFIAWLNLAWLGYWNMFLEYLQQNMAPVCVPCIYIWAIVGLVILVSHSVLASSSHIQRSSTHWSLYFVTSLEYPTCNKTVWLYDANIEYLREKHIPLVVVAVLVFLFFFLTLFCFSLASGCRHYHIWDSSHGSPVPGWNLLWILTMLPT